MLSAPSSIACTNESTLRPAGSTPRGAPSHALVHERLDSQPPRERRREQHPRVSDRPIIVKGDLDRVQRIVHHTGDLLSGAADAVYSHFLPA